MAYGIWSVTYCVLGRAGSLARIGPRGLLLEPQRAFMLTFAHKYSNPHSLGPHPPTPEVTVTSKVTVT